MTSLSEINAHIIKKRIPNEKNIDIQLFNTVDELKTLLSNADKNIRYAVVLYECCFDNVIFQFYTDLFNIKYNINRFCNDSDETDSKQFDYLCKNEEKFISNVFMYLSNELYVEDIFIITNDSDDKEKVINKETYSYLKFENTPNIYLTFRGTFLHFNAIEYLPENLINNLYVADFLDNKWLKWEPEYYAKDNNIEIISKFINETLKFEVNY